MLYPSRGSGHVPRRRNIAAAVFVFLSECCLVRVADARMHTEHDGRCPCLRTFALRLVSSIWADVSLAPFCGI